MTPIKKVVTQLDELLRENNLEVNYLMTFNENIELNNLNNDIMFFTASDRTLIDNAYDIDYGILLICLKVMQDALPDSQMALKFYTKYGQIVDKNKKEYVDIMSIEKLEYNNPLNIEILISAEALYVTAKNHYL